MTLTNACPCPNDPCNVVRDKADTAWVCSQLNKKSDKKRIWVTTFFFVIFLLIFISRWISLESKIDILATKLTSVDRVVDDLNHNYVTEKELLRSIGELFDERLGEKK